MVVDAGGGTVDISSYTVNSASPLEVEEFHEPKCNTLSCDSNHRTEGNRATTRVLKL